jgi:hypothetical protein
MGFAGLYIGWAGLSKGSVGHGPVWAWNWLGMIRAGRRLGLA